MLYRRNSIIVDDGLNAVTRPAAWHVEPAVRTAFSTSRTSVQPASARWYAMLQPVIPPPITTTRAWSTLMDRHDTSVAGGGSGVGEVARGRYEVPVVARLMEVEPDDPERPGGAQLAVGAGAEERPLRGAAGPDDELAHAAEAVLVPGRALWREPLIVVLVTVHDHVGAGGVEGAPEGVRRPGVAVDARAESRVVPDCEGAQGGRRLEVGGEPSTLV